MFTHVKLGGSAGCELWIFVWPTIIILFYIFAFGRQECLHINPCLKCVGCSVIGLQVFSNFLSLNLHLECIVKAFTP